jgi:LacI family transcriptional regulator
MDFASNGRVALIVSGQTLERLKNGLVELVRADRDFGVISIRESPARIIEQLLDWHPAGVIMEFREELTEQVAGLGLPTVVVMADLILGGMGCVNVDDRAVGQMAADYLWNKGLRNFGYFGGEVFHAPERRSGFVEALAERRRDVAVLERPLEMGFGQTGRRQRQELDAWLGKIPKPAGVFAAHDPHGRDLLESCRRLALNVPGDVAILSASNDPATCELSYPDLSSVEIPWRRVGLEAGRLLDRMIAGEVPEDAVIIAPTGVRTRQSTDFYRVSDERIQRAVTYMRAQLGEEIDINSVVRGLGMDRRTLERLFRSQLNKSPKEVLTEMRTTRARELLEQSDLRIGEIAERSGFGRSEKLASAFRQRFGKTPREWRKGIL